MRFSGLDQWLAWQETLHPDKIDLGLDRVRVVAERMGLGHPGHLVVTVAGTNGKGSSVAFLESILIAGGYRVGSYTSPHFLKYNERIRIQGEMVSDADLCAAFERVDQARADTSLTYFEFGTLAAMAIFTRQELEIAIMETGLGGRLDAVNILDADVALITSIGIDHVEWLGADRESIGFEKAGIFRPGKPAVCADLDPPDSLGQQANQLGACWMSYGKAFDFIDHGTSWSWWSQSQRLDGLPEPALKGTFQLANAAAVLMTLECLSSRLPVSRAAIEQGIADASLCGRLQVIEGSPRTILDVAHNPAAARAVAQTLAQDAAQDVVQVGPRRILIVLAMLATKDAEGVATELEGIAHGWYLADLKVEGGLTAELLAQRLQRAGVTKSVSLFESVTVAYGQALADAGVDDCVLVCGSFYTVAEVMERAL